LLPRVAAVQKKFGERTKIERSAEAELFHDRGREPPLCGVFKMRLRPPRVEVGKIKPRRIAHEKMQPVELFLAAGGLLRSPVVVGGNFQPRTRRQNFDGLPEI